MGFVANLFKSYPRGSNPTLSGPGLPRVVTSALLLLAGFLLWRELEPNLLFRSTDGVVLGSEVSKVTTYVRRARTDYVPEVDFRYQVNGQSFFSTQYQRTTETRLCRLDAQRLAIGGVEDPIHHRRSTGVGDRSEQRHAVEEEAKSMA